MADAVRLVLSDPFELFRLVIGVLAIGEMAALVWDLRQGYRRSFRLLEGLGGRYRLHEVLRATVRLQLWNLVLRPRGWEDARILLAQAAVLACGLLTWWLV